MPLRRYAVLTFFLTVSLHAAVVAGPERPVAPPQAAGAYGFNAVVDLATDGTDYLTLWRDETPGRYGVYATVIDDRGQVRVVTPEPLVRGSAQVVWTGDAYLVVYHDDGLKALRLNRDAEIVAGPAPIDLDLPNEVLVELVWNGSRALAVFASPSGSRAAILGPSGEVLRSGIVLPASVTYNLTAAAAGQTFVLAWAEENEPQQPGRPAVMTVRAMRISAEGVPGAPAVLRGPTVGWVLFDSVSTANEAGVAFTSSDYTRLTLHRFTIDATTVTPRTPVDIPAFARDLQVVWTPSGFVATYVESGGTTRLGIVPFHASAARTLPVAAMNPYNVRVEANGRSALVVVGGAPVSAAAFEPSFEAPRSNAAVAALAPAARQSTSAIASNGNQALMAWLEPIHATAGRLFVRRFDRAGNALDPQPVFAGPEAAFLTKIGVAFTGRAWLVVWQKDNALNSRVLMRRISPDGALLDDAPIDLGVGSEPAIASNGTVAVVAVTYPRRSGVGILRLSADGERLDSDFVPMVETQAQHAALATNGTEFLLAFTAGSAAIFGRRLDASGRSIDAAPFAIAAGPQYESNPAVASDGTDFLVVYTQHTPRPMVDPPLTEPEPLAVEVRSKRVLRNGTLADFTAQQNGFLLGRGIEPRIAAVGGRYLATFTWDDELYSDREPEPLMIFARQLDRSGAGLDGPYTVVRAESDTMSHALAAVGGSPWMTYARIAPEVGNVQRVFFRTLAEGAARRRTARK